MNANNAMSRRGLYKLIAAEVRSASGANYTDRAFTDGASRGLGFGRLRHGVPKSTRLVAMWLLGQFLAMRP
jgi:hypothetical protein